MEGGSIGSGIHLKREREGWLGLVTPGVGMDSGLGLDPEMKNKTKNLNQPFELPLK